MMRPAVRPGRAIRTRFHAFLLVRARSSAGVDGSDTTTATGMHPFWWISSAIAASRSRSVRLCYRNARSVTSSQGEVIDDVFMRLSYTASRHNAL